MSYLDPHNLAEALVPLLTKKIVVRFEVLRQFEQTQFDAHLLTLVSNEGVQTLVSVRADLVILKRRIEVDTGVNKYNLAEHPNAVHAEICRWKHRQFDDWMHDKQFMGAIAVLRDGQPYTSLKQDADSTHWALLRGLLLGELGTICLESEGNIKPLETLKRRYEAFVAEIESSIAEKSLNYR